MIKYVLPASLNRKIGRAMHDYAMFEDGDKVLVAVSGGVDSLTLACLLKGWQKKAPISFELTAYYVDHGFWKEIDGADDPGLSIGKQMSTHGIDFVTLPERIVSRSERTCYLCSRNRRNQLFDIAGERGYNKIALGHHKDDLIETFMLNAVFNGNISTMLPKQKLFDGGLSLVRPMAYLEKDEVYRLANGFNLEPVENFCSLSTETRREKIRNILQSLYKSEPKAKASLFASLANVKNDYLLKS